MTATTPSRVQSELIAKILDYIESEDLPVGHHLTEAQLAEHFGVSRSPIRAALHVLADRGVLTSTANKGHHVAVGSDELRDTGRGGPAADAPALYDRIARERMRNELPEQFTEALFMRRYDVSRAQLRRTLTDLAHDGLVRRGTGHSWFFLPVLDSAEAIAASYRFRLIIEPAGLLEPTFTLDEAGIGRSLAAHEDILRRARSGHVTNQEIFETNARFHEMLAEMSGNRFLRQNVEQQNRLRRLSEYVVSYESGRVETLVDEHCAIMDALLEGDREWAAALLRRHLQVASRQVDGAIG